jgi:hypothetical protein
VVCTVTFYEDEGEKKKRDRPEKKTKSVLWIFEKRELLMDTRNNEMRILRAGGETGDEMG